jgi:hypothetical protein
MTQPVWPAYPVPAVPPSALTSRREFSTRDSVNARQFEHWQTDGKYLVGDRPDTNKQRPFQDFQPINSRTTDRNYRNQPRYDATATSAGDAIGTNPYFQKYDAAYDNRNAVREVRSAIYEDKTDEGLRESSRLLRRNFDTRWLAPAELDKLTETRMVLRPSMDDIRKIYTPALQGGSGT